MANESGSPSRRKGHNSGDGIQPIEEEYPDLEFKCRAPGPMLVPNDVYHLGFVRAEQSLMWKTLKVFLWFTITDIGEYFGKELYMACNMPMTRRWAMSSKYWQTWTLAAGCRPHRKDRLSTRIFRGKIFMGRVRRVESKSTKSGHTPRHPEQQYSVVEELISVCAGEGQR